MTTHFKNAAHTQKGAVLVTSLLILLVLTVIGITAMQVTRMQERMAGNTRDVSLGFQAAEAALRDAENQLNDYVTPPALCIAAGDKCDTVYERRTLPNMAEAIPEWWSLTARELGAQGSQQIEGVAEDPRYAVEELSDIRNCLEYDGSCGRRTIYQVTARSTGASGEADVLLQSTYAKPPY